MVAVLVVVVLASLIFCVSCAKKEPGETGTPAAEKATPAAEGSQPPGQSVDTGNAYASYLTPADVEKVTGRAGMKSIPRNSVSGAGGDLNFTTSDDELALMVQIVAKNNFAQFKQAYFKSAVAGVGDEAFQGGTIASYPPNLVVFAKGETCVALLAFGDAKADKPANLLTTDQMTELAKVIASRM
jgi:hypothetical protein